ncbi:MAG TPA: hypothetical protein VFG00_12795 [Acidothermaceae bacterium]|nr:hypothetical protein [Acidothermaceae bacterium]
MRLATAIGVIAVTLAAAVYVREGRVANPVYNAALATCAKSDVTSCTISVAARVRPCWEDPVAVLLALGGVAIAVGVVTTGRERP